MLMLFFGEKERVVNSTPSSAAGCYAGVVYQSKGGRPHNPHVIFEGLQSQSRCMFFVTFWPSNYCKVGDIYSSYMLLYGNTNRDFLMFLSQIELRQLHTCFRSNSYILHVFLVLVPPET